ncbi:MAG TPA: protein phosphatase 2C domain-containing protein [Thermomicrobiales bacterium]|nr:protein phosphatase 2C domain-containing protein [Thermomicrobiales bacterium]
MSLVPDNLQITVGSATEAAGRQSNEDAVLVTQLPEAEPGSGPGFLLAVADGMGGLERGEVASHLAIELLNDLFARDRPEDVAQALKQAYRRANDAIYRQSIDNPQGGGMGTTLVSAVIQGKYATIANVGDSRAYLIRANQLTQVTQDHSVVADQVAKGHIREEEARTSPQRNLLTHALGTHESLDRRMPSVYELTLLPEDRLLLCSDGFFDVLEMKDYLGNVTLDDPQASAVRLAALATERGTTDNVSAVVVAVSPSTATVQRELIGTEIARQRGASPLLVPILLLVIVVIAIVLGAFFYL